MRQVELKVHIEHQRFTCWEGMRDSWGIIVNGRPKAVFYSLAETRAYLRGLGVEYGSD